METTKPPISEEKYQKLASEYAKLRGQASVLKKAVLEEKAKNTSLRDQLRQRETALRRSEQEVDSLGFRNKQLEHRVASLQDELAHREAQKKRGKDTKHVGKAELPQQVLGVAGNGDTSTQDALIFEELQKKIMENAQLTSLIDDKERDVQLHTERIAYMEECLEKRSTDYTEMEKRLRRDIEILQSKNSDLETKLVEAASMLGSEDALSASGSDNTPLQLHNTHQNHINSSSSTIAQTSSDDRIAFLEREVSHWRTQYEIAKLSEAFSNNNIENVKHQNVSSIANNLQAADAYCSCSSAAAGITVKPSFPESKSAQRAREALKEHVTPPTKEQLIYNTFSKKFEDLILARYMAESRISSFESEAGHMQMCLEHVSEQLKGKEEELQSMNQTLRLLDEDLATTRLNYEEQISVLTEQVISLSDQLAACK